MIKSHKLYKLQITNNKQQKTYTQHTHTHITFYID